MCISGNQKQHRNRIEDKWRHMQSSPEEPQGMGEERKAGHQLRVSFQSPNLTFLEVFF